MPDLLPQSYYAGLSGLALPIPKYQFPEPFQQTSRLTYYASMLNSIEINSSFYKLPVAGTITKWAACVPHEFTFTFKLWKQITHNKGLYFEKEDVVCFMNAISSAGDKRGCVLLQFPPSLGIESKSQLEYLVSSIIETDPERRWKFAVEFRHKSWYDDSIYQLLDSFNITVVIQDIPKSATPMLDMEADTIYVRFHGPTGNYRGSYEDDILTEYAEYVTNWIEDRKTVFVYFNNTMGDAFNNLQHLNTLIRNYR